MCWCYAGEYLGDYALEFRILIRQAFVLSKLADKVAVTNRDIYLTSASTAAAEAVELQPTR